MANYHLKCNAPKFEQHRAYPYNKKGQELAISDFQSLQRQFEDKWYLFKVFFRNNPLRGTIQVEIDGFYYYVELYKEL